MADEQNVAGPEPPSNPAQTRSNGSPHPRTTPKDRKDSRSRSPIQRDRYGRIRSPDRRDRDQTKDRHSNRDHSADRRPKRRDNPPKGPKGFAWKDTRKRDDDTTTANSSDDRFRRRDEREAGSRYDKFKRDDQRDNDSYRPSRPSSDRRTDNNVPPKRDAPSSSASSAPMKKISAAPSERMIVVHVNDRLGTKAKVPCFPSDSVKLFKAQVAAMIGRQPHEIMLKRQSERPFKDQLTLLDYGVSDGVQLDLELDTGD